MSKIIRLKKEIGKVYVNIKTLRYTSLTVYIPRIQEKDWVQIEDSKVKEFIAEQKAQIQNTAVDTK